MLLKLLWRLARTTALVALIVFITEQVVGTNIFIRFGSFWISVDEESPYVSRSVKLALRDPVPEVEAGPMTWREVRDGFEVAELPVVPVERKGNDDAEVDRIFLARIDPSRYRFELHNDSGGKNVLHEWQKQTGALLIVNGSYYDHAGLPSTPSIIKGQPLGPADYEATHGAFIVTPAGARLLDLGGQDWKEALKDADHAFVSYPLLMAEDGSHRVRVKSNWLANRSFIAQNQDGKIVVGTTDDAFFSLTRLAEFLKDAPLDLKLVLNLDGGPVACQSVDVGAYRRSVCGEWEVQVEKDEAKMLPPLSFLSAPRLPIVIAVYPKSN